SYEPKTEETKQIYKILLNFIQETIGDQVPNILSDAAYEILCILKNDRLRDKERQNKIEALLLNTKLSPERFAFLINLGKQINDWSSNDEIIPNDQTENVNVQFEGSSDEENNFDDFDVSDGEEMIIDDTIQEIRVNKTNDSNQRSQTLQPRTIDALWLQR
ncbi:unnamed protein product, partial [Adineta steineri]